MHISEYGKAKAMEQYNDKAVTACFKEMKKTKQPDFAYVIAAYEYYVMENKTEALEIINHALKTMEKRPNLGERVMGMEVLTRLREGMV
jgi:hypothetical protein